MDSFFAQKSTLDRRVARTRARLAAALIRLALDRDFKKITIQALVDTADIGYATFHRHYRNMDELLERTLMPVWDALQQRIADQDTLYDESLALFRCVKGYPDLWRILHRLPNSNPVRQTIDCQARTRVIARWEQRHDTTVPFLVSISAIEHTTNHLIRFYLDNTNTYTPRQMASMHLDLVLKPALNVLRLREGWILVPAE